jgi:hypothetical protein
MDRKISDRGVRNGRATVVAGAGGGVMVRVDVADAAGAQVCSAEVAQ